MRLLICLTCTFYIVATCFAGDSPVPFAHGVFDVINSTSDTKQLYRFDSDRLGGYSLEWLNRTTRVRVAGIVGFGRNPRTSPTSLKVDVRMLGYSTSGLSPLTLSRTWIGLTIRDLEGKDVTAKFNTTPREVQKRVWHEPDQQKLMATLAMDDYSNRSPLFSATITPKNSTLPFIGEKTPAGQYVLLLYLSTKSHLPPFNMPSKSANFFPFAAYRFKVGGDRNAAVYTYDTRISEARRRAVSDRTELDGDLIFDETVGFSKEKTWVYFNANTGSAKTVRGFIWPSRQPSQSDTHVLHIFYQGMREFAGCEILFQPRRKGQDYKPNYKHVLAHLHADPKYARYTREFFETYDKADRVYFVNEPGSTYSKTIGDLRAVVRVVAVKTASMVEEGYGRLTGFAELKLRVQVYKTR